MADPLKDLLASEQAEIEDLLNGLLNGDIEYQLDESQLQAIGRTLQILRTPAPPPEERWLVAFIFEDGACAHRFVIGDEERADQVRKMIDDIEGDTTAWIAKAGTDDFDMVLEEWMEVQIQNSEDEDEP